MSDEPEIDRREELASYLDEVEAELRRREFLLANCQRELFELEFKLKETRSSRGVIAGDAFKVSTIEEFRTLLRARIALKKKDLKMFLEDVERARERKGSVEAEIETIGKSEEL